MLLRVETSRNQSSRSGNAFARGPLYIRHAVACIVLAVATAAPDAGRAQEPACASWSAKVLAAEGPVELKRVNLTEWMPAKAEDRLCEGDSLRVGAFGRAAVALPDETVLRLDQFTTITFTPPEDEKRSWLDLLTGTIHIISRDPRALRVTTPFANAGIEGTEFSVAVTDSRTDVAVLEGTVALTNAAGEVDIGSDQIASAGTGTLGPARSLSDPYAIVGWTRYHPVVIPGQLPSPDAGVPADPAALAARAQSRLRVGRSADAEADLARSLGLAAGNADALAVQALIELSRGQLEAAQAAVGRALARAPSSASALLASAHVQQRRGDLEGAAATLRQAAAAHTENALVWARLAEIDISLGNYEGGLDAAMRAETLDPGNALTPIALGFVALSAGDSDAAEGSFREAVRREPAAPLARLGLALALIRDGALEPGRAELENAVMLDAGDGIVRSYMAKAYYDERRTALAASQLEAAKRLDPTDPTPWLYDAIRKQNANEPIAALKDLRTASALNDDHPAFRSTLRLDDDLAARSAGRGRLYRDLGFEQLALLEGWTEAVANPLDFAGHRLLADVYSTLPRHQIARVNELYQAQLLQPGNIILTQPQLGEANLFMLNSAGPVDLAHLELDPLLNHGGIRFQGSAITGGNDTSGETLVIAGIRERVDYNVGAFHYETLGFRQNNDFEQDLVSAFLQFRYSKDTSIEFELRSNSIDRGDLDLLFDPRLFSPLERHSESADSLRLGVRHAFSTHSLLIGSLAYQDADLFTTTGVNFRARARQDGFLGQIQHLYQADDWSLISGAAVSAQDLDNATDASLPIPFPPFAIEVTERIVARLQYVSLYSYASFPLTKTLSLTAGASVDLLDGQSLETDQFNPKLGLIWIPTPRTVIRATAFQTLHGPVVSKQIIQPKLEPSHVAGFNQFYFGSEGDQARQAGLAFDHELSAELHLGGELSRRKIETPILIASGPTTMEPILVGQPIDESLARAYAYWTPTDRLAVSSTLEVERVDNHGEILAEGFSSIKTRRMPTSVNYFAPSGFSAGLTATPVHQSGVFGGMGTPPTPGEDSFWVFDMSLGYRLPNRRGLVELTARNLFDEEFRFQDTDPETPRIFPERFVGLRFTLSY